MERKVTKLDANESIFFGRELEAVKAKTYDRVYPELMARTLIPVATDVDPGAETIVYKSYDQVGMAKIISNYADDLPSSDVKGVENVSRVRGLGSSYHYSLQEIRAAAMAGKPLKQAKGDAAKRAIAELENRLAFFGDANYNIKGLFNAPNITQVVIPNGAAGSPLWAQKTADEILADLNAVANAPSELTNMAEQADVLLLPVTRFNLINSKARSATSDKTILKFFLENNAYIKQVQPVNEMKAAFGGLEAIFAYRRSPDVLEMQIPQDFEQLPVEPRGLTFLVDCHERFGGTTVYRPLGVAYGSGI